MKIKFKKLTPTAKAPTRAYEHDAGYDLYVDSINESHTLPLIIYGCGCAFEIPIGYVGLIFPRSSVVKTDLRLANSVGVIDSGYRGEITAVFDDIAHTSIAYSMGDRFAQLVIMPLAQYELEEADELSESDRGKGGYGSSGK